jgi:hypothetical protein
MLGVLDRKRVKSEGIAQDRLGRFVIQAGQIQPEGSMS